MSDLIREGISDLLGNSRREVDAYKGERESKKCQTERYVTVEHFLRVLNDIAI